MARICWEQGEIFLIPLHPPPQKEENRARHECMLSLPIGCMKFLCSKTVHHHFWPRLIPPLETEGTYLFIVVD